MFNLHLSAEQIEIRDMVRDFVTAEIRPVMLKSDRLDAGDRSLPSALLDQASQIGLRTLALSDTAGGAGADNLTSCIVIEELAAGDADIAAVLSETSTLAPLLFGRAMTAAQRERFLPQFLADDRYHLALAGAGTDGVLGVNYHRPAADDAAVAIAASRDADSFILNGMTPNVPNAPVAKLFAVEIEAGTILVPRDATGLTVRERDAPNRWFHGACADVHFENCRVPADNLLAAQAPLAADAGRGRPRAAALNLGIGRAAYEAALEYAQLRVQGGRRIIEHQAIGTKLADIAIKLDVARTMIWRAAWASDHPDAHADRSLPDLPLTAITTTFTAEAVYEATKEAAECFGAMGVMRDMPLQKYVHDALVCLHSGAGTSEAKLRIAEVLAGYRRPALRAAE